MIVPTEDAITAAYKAFQDAKMLPAWHDHEGKRTDIWVSVDDFRSVLADVISAAIPHLTDTGQPLQCGDLAGRSTRENCDCGHQIGLHRKTESGRVVCDPCHIQAGQAISPELARRLDEMIDVMLRQERRFNDRMNEVQGSVNRLIEVVVSHLNPDAEPSECVTGPTDYEVWRDALTLAVNDHNRAKLGANQDLLNHALWFRDRLKRPIRDAPHSEQQPEPFGSSILPSDQAISAAIAWSKQVGADVPGSVVGGIINAAIPHLIIERGE